ncbi:BREX-1 system adenine-specific DNA-methyltransferase PglX [Methylonatrum kenyense]|uniref:N-6 DNA methylase n=1 Tax=Methylonatrum kenyense TaxID=455253 RepID=UPI0020BEE4B3|nr:N-6 DNA methylase [Methylonatrum kenyense]MCK8514975.1 BREX-1 system adenine-specific DNA-methyltransferase PglX [Methylonatrum kenyense]
MQPLDKTLRSQLERAVKAARDIAETGARAALEQLGVGDPAPASHLSETDRELRRKLRAHGRQLGDALNGGKVLTMDRLVEEIAYEHWHRMLFARFLAENDLLMYPDPDEPVAITLEECEDLAADEGATNGWELAARYAARMLPQIFRLDSPVFQLALPPEHQQALERQVADLPLEVFTASDSLGWVYQFWQAKKKEQVNQSEVKIGARELPAVTQLFTEPYMVSFLLDNALGAWWAARQLSEEDLKNAESEGELRQKAAIPGVPLEYLRFVKQEDATWTPAAGTFDTWPERLADLKTLDPCCGSGHFLVAAFLMLVPMRMERDGLSARDAVDAVLRENIHGLELDQRCVELAAFALALTAWKYPGAGSYRALPDINLACSGLSITAEKEDWLELAGDNNDLRMALKELYRQFKDAPVLGSLINPASSLGIGSLFELKWDEVGPLLTRALADEGNDEIAEMSVVAKGIAKAAELLASKYEWVITNVPYKTKGDLTQQLQQYLEEKHFDSKAALETAFLDRCLSSLVRGGRANLVLPQNFLFLSSYKRLRRRLLQKNKLEFISWLGEKAFTTPVDAAPILISIANQIPADSSFMALDLGDAFDVDSKANALKLSHIVFLKQQDQLANPDHRITIKSTNESSLLSAVAYSNQGIPTSDTPLFVQFFWEQFNQSEDWEYFQSTLGRSSFYGGKEKIVLYENGNGKMRALSSAQERDRGRDKQGKNAWDKTGISVNLMGTLSTSLYGGNKFDINVGVITPADKKYLAAIWTYCYSDAFDQAVRTIDKKRNVTIGTLVKVPFDLAHWTKEAEGLYPNGLPEPYSDDSTQWIFHGHLCGSVVWDEEEKWTVLGPLRTDDTVLQIAVARLLGYRWPAELDTDMELANEQREWVKRCEALLPFADEDGIVCIPPVRGEASAADRLLNLLATAYGEAWSTDVLAKLLKSADHAGKTLETWLRDKFFAQHCKLFQHRPFIWHIWDGLSDGFAVLVNYHKLGRKNLETLIYTYLGDWISRQKQDQSSGVDGAEERLAAAESLKKKLEQILEGEAPYDIFVRWKPIEQQPIGWDPDLNDGIRLNIRPFMTVGDVKKKGAGILRDKPNIKWTKDRGKDVESAPWYQTFKGERINDHHLTLAEKRAARKKV